jgi:hypothetical protein
MQRNPSAFVVYSWDSDEHKEWVAGLVNALRHKGADATIDVFQTQKGTINLYVMMVENIRSKDYVIVVLTPEYAKKADALRGGVGYETSLLLSLIQENLQKIIPIVRCNEDPSKAIPFYLKGVQYIDFSPRHNFEEKFQELLHRIFKVDLLEQAPLGKIPDLKPRKIATPDRAVTEDIDDLIPDFREITDADKNKFMRRSFGEIRNGLVQVLVRTKEENSNFDFDYEDITNRKTIYKMYINGSQKCAVKLWLANAFGASTDTINLACGNYTSDSDNSMNEIIDCEVSEDKTLKLRMTLNIFGDKEASTSSEVLREIWKNIIQYLR